MELVSSSILVLPKQMCEISASGWFYYKEICYDARSHERKTPSYCPISSIPLVKLMFTFFAPYIVIYLCIKNQQNAHFLH